MKPVQFIPCAKMPISCSLNHQRLVSDNKFAETTEPVQENSHYRLCIVVHMLNISHDNAQDFM